MPSGRLIIDNGDATIWESGSEWTVSEIVRLGSTEGEGPEVFGNITAFAVDNLKRIWILDDHAQQIRVFTESGSHVRSLGRKGGGPGEFSRAVRIDVDPSGRVWVMDPENNRLSVFDSAGKFVYDKPSSGTFLIFPWPGGFDEVGRYYAPVPRFKDGNFSFGLARYDTAFNGLDTLEIPRDPRQRKKFSLIGAKGGLSAGVPFQGGLVWRISRKGNLWGLLTDEYKIFELNDRGDTIRSITRAFTHAPVTERDREEAREDLKWFTSQGGRIDWSQLPSTKPVANGIFEDDEGNVWVDVVSTEHKTGSSADIFDRDGRYLGALKLPFFLKNYPVPLVSRSRLYAVARDSLDTPFFVIANIRKPQ
ncbi:MAG: 6-bladed beta-propeller [Gemmatimonadota bacterium]